MYKIILLILGITVFTDWALAQGDAPPLLQGQAQTSKQVGAFIQVPNSQVTKINSATGLLETGNKNILVNPSFEHSAFLTGWTDGHVGITPSPVVETTVVIDGKKSLSLTVTKDVRIFQDSSLYAAQFADGVQGLASVRLKSNITNLYVCARKANVTQATSNGTEITNCAKVDTSNTWGLYKVPFILGGTNNGIAIVSLNPATAASFDTSGLVYIDDAFVGPQDLKQDVNNVGPWTAYTPTFTGVGTVSNSSGKWRQAGESIEVEVSCTTGTSTAALASITLPNSYTIDSSKVNIVNTTANPGVSVGKYNTSQPTAGMMGDIVLAPSTSTSLVYFGDRDGNAASHLTPSNGSASISSSAVLSVSFKVPITQFAGSSSIYSASCGANCVDSFSAKIDDGTATTTVYQENAEFITGNCTNASAGVYVCTLNGFTVAPNCFATESAGTIRILKTDVTSNTSVSISSFTDAGVASDSNFQLLCQKQGADFVATRTIVGSFSEVNTSPGILKPKTCHYAFGGASATLAAPTECTTGTCVEVYDSCGTGTPPSWFTVALYASTTWASGTWANSSFIDCKCTAFDTTTGTERTCTPYFGTGLNTWQTSSSGGLVVPVVSNGTAYVNLTCTGNAP